MNKEKDTISQLVHSMETSVKDIRSTIEDVSDEGLYLMMEHLMDRYLYKNVHCYSDYNGMMRNEFVEKTVKALNSLYEKHVFQEEYHVSYMKSVKKENKKENTKT